MATGHTSTAEGEDLFEVEAILDVRTVNNVKEYLVRWLGWAPEYDTWEPGGNLLTCHDLIETFHSNRQPTENVETKAESSSTKKGNRGSKTSGASSQREKSSVSSNNLSNDDQLSTTPAQISQSDPSMEQSQIDIPAGANDSNLNDSMDSAEITASTTDVTESSGTESTPKKKRKRRPQKQFWEMIPDTASTLRDPFWKNLEEGNIAIDNSGLYERVKRGRRIQEMATTSMSTTVSRKTRKRRKTEKASTDLEEDADQKDGKDTKESSEDGPKENGDRPEEFSSETKESEGIDLPSNDQPILTDTERMESKEDTENAISNVGCQEDEGKTEEILVRTEIIDDRSVQIAEAPSVISAAEKPEEPSKEIETASESQAAPVQIVVEEAPTSMPEKPEKQQADEISIPLAKVDGETDQSVQPKQPEVEKKETPVQLSPTSKTPIIPGGQWRQMKPIQRPGTKLVIEDTEIASNEVSISAPVSDASSSTIAKSRTASLSTPGSWMPNVNGISNGHRQATSVDSIPSSPLFPSLSSPLIVAQPPSEPIPTETAIPDLPLPLTSGLSLSSFFKGELRQSQSQTGNQRSVRNFNDFEQACCNGDVEAVRRALLAKKSIPVDVNGRNSISGNPVLMQVCLLACDPVHKLDDIIDLLASNGANLNSRNDAGDTALTMAINRNQVCKVTKLLSLGAAINLPNHQGETPLMLACKKNFTGIVFRLLEYGADFNAQSADGKTALDYAKEATANAGGKGCESGLRDRADKIMKVFDQALRMVVSTERFHVLRPLFPLHCYALNESNAFRIVFFFEDPPIEPSLEMTYVLAIAKARFMSIQQVDVRFWGTTPVKTVLLNEVEQRPVTSDGRFLYSLWPIKKGYNDLVITCNTDCKQSQHKLLIHAYALRVLCI